jgi:hypothetical protein
MGITNFNETIREDLYRKWRRLGWEVDAPLFDGYVDPEETIILTTHAGRHDDRLFQWLLTWVRDYHDLINTKRLLRLAGQADAPILGAVFDIAMAHGADRNFRTITGKCRPSTPPQILFHAMNDTESLRKQEIDHGLPVYRNWGLFCTSLRFYDDAAALREKVLRLNPQLAVRALLGPNIRAEILFHLQQQAGIAIKTLADGIGYAYSAVHKEVEGMVKNGLLVEKIGRAHQLFLSEHARRVLAA